MSRKLALILIGGALVGILVGVALAGGDDSPDREPPLPELGIPRTTEPPPDEGGATGATGPDTTSPDSGADGGSGGGTGGTQTPSPDTETNDVPPPEGSPAERFEFCQDNPGAC